MSGQRALTVVVLCLVAVCALILAIVGCASPAHAQERQALVVPEKDAAELLKAHKALVDAQKIYDETKARLEKRLVPKDWPCCVFEWSTDFRVLWPQGIRRDYQYGNMQFTPGYSYSVPNSTLELRPDLAINPIHPVVLGSPE